MSAVRMPAPADGSAIAGAVNVREFQALARQRLDAAVYDYCAGAAGGERTLAENRKAFRRVPFRPRVLIDTSHVDLSVTLLGERVALPVLLAPIAFNCLVHSEGELAAARAAHAAGTIFVLSTMASSTIEDVAAVAPGPLWFQLYVFRDRGLTQALVRRAEDAGYRALVLTVDTPRIGHRERDVRNRFALPAGIVARNLDAHHAPSRWESDSTFSDYNGTLIDPALTWSTVEWVRSLTSLPVVLKGILTADDAAQAVSAGAAGIIVSNHGGRQLDGTVATLDALPEVVDRVADRCMVLLDGGVRRGTDVLAALALGAKAILIGRPYLWGLAVAGEEGVRQVVQMLRDELELALALAGCQRASAVTRSLVSTDRQPNSVLARHRLE